MAKPFCQRREKKSRQRMRADEREKKEKGLSPPKKFLKNLDVKPLHHWLMHKREEGGKLGPPNSSPGKKKKGKGGRELRCFLTPCCNLLKKKKKTSTPLKFYLQNLKTEKGEGWTDF